jgi:hypothetical protein
LVGADVGNVPDYTTICRRRGEIDPPDVASVSTGAGVVVIIDSTGARLDSRAGWVDDKPGGDHRRGKYLKVHVGIDADTGVIVSWDITKAFGSRTGDPSVAPALIYQAAMVARTCAAHVDGGLGDGAYDAVGCYQALRRAGGRWYAPLSACASRGRHPDRDRHIDGVARLGEVYDDRLG